MVFALTFLSLTSTLLPQRTIGMFSQTRTRSPVRKTLVLVLVQQNRVSESETKKCRMFKYLFILLQTQQKSRESLTMPIRNVFVRNAGSNVEHNDAALAVDVVSVTESTKLLLASRVPDIELDFAEILREKRGSRLGEAAPETRRRLMDLPLKSPKGEPRHPE